MRPDRQAYPFGTTSQRAMRRARRGGLASDTAGVSDVLGSILLVGLTVVMASALGVLLLNFEGPKDRPQTSLTLTALPGNANWGNGDEVLIVRHLGGDDLRSSSTTIAFSINNGNTTSFTGNQLNFTGGSLSIGESWTSAPMLLQATDSVSFRVVHRGATSVVLGSTVLIPAQVSSGSSCPFDTSVPSASWVQSPANLNITSGTQAVNITLSLSDDCAGVNPAVIPQIYSGITPASPALLGNMTSQGNNVWTATIPAPAGGWSLQGLRSLQYYVSPLTDLRGNSAQSTTRVDLIELTGATQHYVNAVTPVAPTTTVTGTANLAAEDGVVASFAEGNVVASCTGGTTTISTNAEVTTAGWGTTGTNPRDATTSNNGYRTNGDSDEILRLGFPNPTAACPITSVTVAVEQSISVFINDGWQVQACTAGGSCGTLATFQLGSLSDTTLNFNITTLLPPGVSAWDWTAINNLEVAVNPTRGGGSDDGTWRVDHVQVVVEHPLPAPTTSGGAQFNWTGVPAGSAYYLDLRYTTTPDEAFFVNVWNWTSSSFTSRGTLPAGTSSLTQFTYILAASEVQSGAVRVRLIDANPNDGTASTVTLDYARIDRV